MVFFSVLCLLCLCVRLFIFALWSPAGKGLTSWLSYVVSAVSLSLTNRYPGSGVVLDCIDSGEILDKLKARDFNATSLSTSDFSTLYTTLPHNLI